MGESASLLQTGPGYLQEFFVSQEEEKKGRELIQEGILIGESLNNRLYVAHGYCDLGSKSSFWVILRITPAYPCWRLDGG